MRTFGTIAAAILAASFNGYDVERRDRVKTAPYSPPKPNDAAHIAKAEEKRRRRAEKRMRQMLDQCEGSDDPEERCPRHPRDCVCWKFHAALKEAAND